MKPLLTLAADLANRKTTSQALVEDALMRIAIASGEGTRVFMRTHRESALAEAKASDSLRAHGVVPSPLAGIPVSVKDLFDVAGDITRAGSKVLADAAPATAEVKNLSVNGGLEDGKGKLIIEAQLTGLDAARAKLKELGLDGGLLVTMKAKSQ